MYIIYNENKVTLKEKERYIMSRKRNLLLFTTSFLGGLAAGFLLTPRKGGQNRTWLSENVLELKRWTKSQHRTAKRKGSQEINKLGKSIQQGIQQNIPDLYEATDAIPLSDDDILNE